MADKRFSDLPSATALADADLLAVSQSGTSKQISGSLLKSYAQTGVVLKDATTGSAYLPTGTTAQRTASPTAGLVRYNSTTQKFEGYGSAWGNLGGGAAIGDTAPANPGTGDLWWNSLDGHLYVYYGSIWVDAFAGGEGQYLSLTGGTLSGGLNVNTVGAGVQLKQTATGAATYYTFDNTVETGGKKWRFGYTGAAGTSVGQFNLYNQTDNILGWVTDAAGNFGLNVSPSAWGNFKVIESNNGAFWASQTNATALYIGLNAYFNGSTWVYKTNAQATFYEQYNGTHLWFNSNGVVGTAAGTWTTPTQAMTLDANGGLIVGNTSIASGFSGLAQIEASGATGGVIINSSANNLGRLMFTNSNASGGEGLIRYNHSDQAMQFWTNAIDRAHIDSAGNWLVGTTSQLYGTGATISTATRNSSANLNIQAANGAGYDAALYLECPGSFGSTIQTQRSSGLLRVWNGAGTAGVTLAGAGTSWGTFSDERLKDIIEPIENAVEKVSKLRAVIAKYKSDPDDKRRSVLIAQDVQVALPEAVYDDKSEEKYLSVAYTDTIPLLVAAIKELTTRLEALEAH